MKNLLCLLSVLFMSAGCGPDDTQNTDAVKLSVDKEVLEFTAEGGQQTFTVTSSDAFYFPAFEVDWISAKKGVKNSENETVVTVTATENPLSMQRKTRMYISTGTEKIHVDIVQKAVGEGVPDGPLAQKLPHMLGAGWNLGNHFDGFSNGVSSETAWGNPKTTQAAFNKIKAAGFQTVRIPVTWLGHIGEAPDYKIDEVWLNRVAEVVGYAEQAGLMAIVNIHHDGSDSAHWLDIINASKDPAVHQQILEQVTAMWTQIAGKFKDKGDFLIFEAFNEIHDGSWGWGDNRKDGGKQYRCLNEWNQAFVNAVRATGGMNATRILGVPAYCTNVDIAMESFVMPEDSAEDRLILSVHCYDPSDYTLTAKYSEWGHTANSSKKAPGDNEAELKKVFDKIRNNFISKGIPVYLGEFGCVNRGDAREQAFQQYYFRYFAKLARMNGVPVIVWDNGAKGAGNERHAFLDHGTGEYCSPEAEAAIKALIGSYNDNLTLDEVYNNAPKY